MGRERRSAGIRMEGAMESLEWDHLKRVKVDLVAVQRQQRGVINQGTFKKVTETVGGAKQEGSSLNVIESLKEGRKQNRNGGKGVIADQEFSEATP